MTTIKKTITTQLTYTDIIRCSVTFRDVSDLLDGYNHFLDSIKASNGKLSLCRTKNGFNKILNKNDINDSGYRDLKLNVLYISNDGNTKMISEIQFLIYPFLAAKKKSHKLYAILREKMFYEMIVNKNIICCRRRFPGLLLPKL